MSNRLRENNHSERTKRSNSAATDRQIDTPYGVTSTTAVETIWGTETVDGIRGISTQENSSS